MIFCRMNVGSQIPQTDTFVSNLNLNSVTSITGNSLHFHPPFARNLRSRFLAPMVLGLMSTVYNPMKDMETTAYKTAPKVMVLDIRILYCQEFPKILSKM